MKAWHAHALLRRFPVLSHALRSFSCVMWNSLTLSQTSISTPSHLSFLLLVGSVVTSDLNTPFRNAVHSAQSCPGIPSSCRYSGSPLPSSMPSLRKKLDGVSAGSGSATGGVCSMELVTYLCTARVVYTSNSTDQQASLKQASTDYISLCSSFPFHSCFIIWVQSEI